MSDFLARDAMTEEPMIPITMWRNALGIEQGGNGENFRDDDYRAAALYWDTHILVK